MKTRANTCNTHSHTYTVANERIIMWNHIKGLPWTTSTNSHCIMSWTGREREGTGTGRREGSGASHHRVDCAPCPRCICILYHGSCKMHLLCRNFILLHTAHALPPLSVPPPSNLTLSVVSMSWQCMYLCIALWFIILSAIEIKNWETERNTFSCVVVWHTTKKEGSECILCQRAKLNMIYDMVWMYLSYRYLLCNDQYWVVARLE